MCEREREPGREGGRGDGRWRWIEGYLVEWVEGTTFPCDYSYRSNYKAGIINGYECHPRSIHATLSQCTTSSDGDTTTLTVDTSADIATHIQ